MTAEDFPLSWQPSLHSISSIVTFQAKNWHLVVPLSRLEWKNCTCPDKHRHFNWPAKPMVHQTKWIPHSIFWSVWKFPSQPDQKIHVSFQFSSPFCVCRKCWQGLHWASSPSKMYFSYMRLLHCTAVHNFCQKHVFIICPIRILSYTTLYDILRISG